ncbi:MAG: helix-turn-helix transcriptional regulator [Actinomycetes bacterium]
MNRTDRLYALVEELRHAGSRGRTAERLADRFEVSTRTVKRDVSALQQAGVPIWATGGPGGGYVLDARASLPAVNFTPGEAVAVAVALATQPGIPFGADGQSALGKVLDAMVPAQRDRAERLAGRLWVRPRGLPFTPVSRSLEQALEDEVVVILDYVDAEGRRTTAREVEPYVVALDDGKWFLVGWCRRRDGARWFRLDRIERAFVTTEPVPARDPAVFGAPPDDARPVR